MSNNFWHSFISKKRSIAFQKECDDQTVKVIKFKSAEKGVGLLQINNDHDRRTPNKEEGYICCKLEKLLSECLTYTTCFYYLSCLQNALCPAYSKRLLSNSGKSERLVPE